MNRFLAIAAAMIAVSFLARATARAEILAMVVYETKAADAMLQAEPKLPEKDAYWLADYVMRTDGA